MSQRGPITLPPTNVSGNSNNSFKLHWGHNRIPHHYYVSTFRPGRLVIDLVAQTEADKRQVKEDHERLQATLGQQLDHALDSQAGSLEGLSEVAAIDRRIAATDQLIAQYQTRLQQVQQQANSFFGSDPEHRTLHEFVAATTRPNAPADPRAAWLASYRAAFEAKHLVRQIGEIGRRRLRLQRDLANAKLKATQREQVAKLINRVELELNTALALGHEYQLSRATLETLINDFQRHQHEDIAEETALQHADELEHELSQLIQTQVTVRKQAAQTALRFKLLQSAPAKIDFTLSMERPTTPIERRSELLQLKQSIIRHSDHHHNTWPEEKAAVAELLSIAKGHIHAGYDEKAHLSMLSGQTPSNTPLTFHAWTASTRHALVLASSAGGLAHFEAVWDDLGQAVSKGAVRLLAEAAVTAARALPLMLYSARLGDGERMGVSVPLAYLTPGADLTQEANRRAGQTLELALRMNATPRDARTEVYLVATDGSNVLRDVRVRQAQWDTAQGAYRFTAEGPGAATLLWHPATPPTSLDRYDPESGNAIPGLPIVEDLQKHYPGSISTPPAADIREFPELADTHIDDYVIIFPADSGLAPIYVMFRDPREIAGVAKGAGQLTTDRFLEAGSTPQGAAIPTRIAERLTGRRFSSFGKLREAIWMEVAADEVFRKHFTPWNIQEMLNGKAPYAPLSGQRGSRMKFELHHIHEVAQGGSVYDLDNIVVMTPNQHINHHRGGQ